RRRGAVPGPTPAGVGGRRDGRGNARDARTPGSGQAEPLDRARQQLVGRSVTARRRATKPIACTAHALANSGRRLPGPARELESTRARHRNDEIEPIEERARELVAIAGEPLCRTRALDVRIAARTAGTEVHRSHELEGRRKADVPGGARDADHAVLERLAQRFESRTLELR